MIRLRIERPNTTDITHESEYDNYSQCEEFIERKVESLCDKGWEANEISGSNSAHGAIELTHDSIADIILISWDTIKNDCANAFKD